MVSNESKQKRIVHKHINAKNIHSGKVVGGSVAEATESI